MKPVTIRRGLDLRRHIETHGPISGAKSLSSVCGMQASRASQWVREQGHMFGVVITRGKVGNSTCNVYSLDPCFDPSTIPPVGKTKTDHAVMAIPGILASGARTVTELSQASGIASGAIQTALYRLRDAGVVVRDMEKYEPNGAFRYRYRLVESPTLDAVDGGTPRVGDVVAAARNWISDFGGVDVGSLADANGWARRTVADRMQRVAPEHGWVRRRVSTGSAAISVYVPSGPTAADVAQSYAARYADGRIPGKDADVAGRDLAQGGTSKGGATPEPMADAPAVVTTWSKSWDARVSTASDVGGSYDLTFVLSGQDAVPSIDKMASVPPCFASQLLAGGVRITVKVEPINVG